MQGSVIIPARYASTRFPGKPLAPIHGLPMIVRVFQRCREAGGIERVIVATDDERIAAVVREHGGEARMTSSSCRTGTERVAEAARDLDTPFIINVQGDEPLIPPANITRVLAALADGAVMATLATALPTESASDPAIVKVVTDFEGKALYFSRSPIPYAREKAHYLRHIGIYGFQKETLLRLVSLPPSPLEETEGLEQLRALQNSIPIRVVLTDEESIAVDEPRHIQAIEERLREEKRWTQNTSS